MYVATCNEKETRLQESLQSPSACGLSTIHQSNSKPFSSPRASSGVETASLIMIAGHALHAAYVRCDGGQPEPGVSLGSFGVTEIRTLWREG